MTALKRNQDSEKIKRRHVGQKLLSYLLAFSFVITLLTFGFILLTDYKRGVSEYEQSSRQIQTSYQQSISYSLWNFDTRQIESQLEGILNFPGVVHVYIESQNNLIHSAGDVLSRSDQRHSFPLVYENSGKEYDLGKLHIDINYTDLYNELQDKALQILLTQFVKTFSVSIFLLSIVRVLVTRRLKVMSDWAGKFSLDNLDAPLSMNSRNGEQDELDLVADAINEMRQTLKQDVIEREKSKAQLETTKEQLSIAIDNAALGLCQYNSQSDTIQCNHHFAQLLGSSQKELEAAEHPMEQFRELFYGEKSAELRERFNQLLFGRIERLQAGLQLMNLAGDEKFLDATIQVISYQESRPDTVLLCLVDKTKELLATRQATELATNLENKVSQRTEELYEEQQRAKANIQKLTTQLERSQHSQSNQLETQFNLMLLQYLKHNNQPMLQLLGEFLELGLHEKMTSLDLSSAIRQWLRHAKELNAIEVSEHLPLSLIMEENEKLVVFLLNCLILREPMLAETNQLELRLNLKGDHAFLTLTFHLASNTLQTHPEHLDLCTYIISSQLQGELSREVQEHKLNITFSLALNRQV